MSGAVSYHAGLQAEVQVAERYAAAGHALRETRWRGKAGEIDLIFSSGAGFVFVEVKKGPSHGAALARVSPRQLARIMRAADEYAGRTGAGLDTEMRIDIATVDGTGRIEVLENATMH